MANLTLTFLYMEREHIGKDVTCVPGYLGEALGCDVGIVSLTSRTNRDLPASFDGIVCRKLFRRGDRESGWYKYVFFWWYLLRHGKRIDILMRFHYSVPTVIEVLLYKWINKRGKVYVKCDADRHIVERFPVQNFDTAGPGNLRERIRRRLYRKAIGKIDVISCETMAAYRAMTGSKSPYFAFGDKLVFVPNGFDERLRCRLSVVPKDFSEKENIMLTVGRLGTDQKNTDMLLRALETVEMKNWKFYLIGPVEPQFRPVIDRFYTEHPEKAESVVFTGLIGDKKELWEFYNRSKVFVLSSVWESYGLVLNEAKRFGCYLVSTDVGAAKDLIGNEYGEFVPQNDPAYLSGVLQNIIDAKTDTDVYRNWDPSEIFWDGCLKPVVDKLR